MTTIASLTDDQKYFLNQAVHLIATDIEHKGVDSAIKVLESDNCLGELANKILQMIATYRHDDQLAKYKYPYGDLINRIQECKGEQEAYKVLMPDEPPQAVSIVAKNRDLSTLIASFVTPLNTTNLAPTPVDRAGCFSVNLGEAIERQLKKTTSLSFETAQGYKTLLGVDTLAAVLTSYCPLLTHIDMSKGGNEVSNALLSAIAAYCPHLESIDLSSCGFTEEGILALVTRCPHLTSLNLADNGRFSIAFGSMLSSIANNSPTLEYIDLSWGIYNAADIAILLKKCTRLKSINLSYSTPISDAEVAALRENNPNVTIAFRLLY
jgi:hypothetical protein